jgi:GTP-binding protein
MSKTITIGLIGRPNVGKSTLFNRLVGARQAVVADVAGTTRDAVTGEFRWNGRGYRVVDLAGWEPTAGKVTSAADAAATRISIDAQKQIQRYLEEADVLVWVVDGTEPAHPRDADLNRLAHRLGKPVILAINKCDHPGHRDRVWEFSRYGFPEMVPVSALHGTGVDDVLAAVERVAPRDNKIISEIESRNDRELRLCIVGRPNVGKSTLLNALAGEDRAIVSPVAGTTRDAIDTVIPSPKIFGSVYTPWEQVRVIDTAGLRRRGAITAGIEAWSAVRTYQAIDQADLVLCVIEASENLTHQDLQIVQRAVTAGKGLLILVNKWDVVLQAQEVAPGTEEEARLRKAYREELVSFAPFLHWTSILFMSARDALYLESIGQEIIRIYQAWNRSYSADELQPLVPILARLPRLQNILRLTFQHARPPVFHVVVEGRRIPHFSTMRAIENVLRRELDIGPTVIKVWAEPTVAKNT